MFFRTRPILLSLAASTMPNSTLCLPTAAASRCLSDRGQQDAAPTGTAFGRRGTGHSRQTGRFLAVEKRRSSRALARLAGQQRRARFAACGLSPVFSAKAGLAASLIFITCATRPPCTASSPGIELAPMPPRLRKTTTQVFGSGCVYGWGSSVNPHLPSQTRNHGDVSETQLWIADIK